MPETECIVNGALGFALRLSQIAGVSPVTLSSHYEGLAVRYSIRRDIGAKLFYGGYVLFSIGFCIWDMTTHIKLTAESMLIDATSKLSFSLTAIVVTTVVFKGANHMKRLIEVINTIQEFPHIGIETQKIMEKGKSKAWVLILYISFILIQHCFNWFTISSDALKINIYYLITTTLFFTIGYTVMVIQEILFVVTTLTITSELRAINDSISQLLLDVKQNTIDRNMPSAHKKVRQLAKFYSYLCESIRSRNDAIGGALFLTANYFMMNFVFSTYTVVMCFRFGQAVPYGSNCIFKNNGLDVAIEVAWCVFHLTNLIVLIEPCHRTDTEVQALQSYIAQIIYCLPRVVIPGPLDNELEMFYRLVVTDQPAFSPLQLYAYNRKFLLKMISWAVSYLVIVFNFK